MKRADNSKCCLEYLLYLNRIVEINAKNNLNDICLHSENLFMHLFNNLLDLNLKNSNVFKKNSVSIDLIDETKKIIIQVTATCSKGKIEKTLKKDVLQKYANEGYTIQFVFIGKQVSDIKNKQISNPFNINFNSKTDIFLTEDILRVFDSLSVKKQEEILEFLGNELPKGNPNNQLDKIKVCSRIRELLEQNFRIWNNFGPESQTAKKEPLNETVFEIWKQQKTKIIDNNSKIIKMYREYKEIFSLEEKKVFLEFEEHAQVFGMNNKIRLPSTAYKRYPQKFTKLIDRILEQERSK